MSILKGIDVSSHRGEIDWAKVKASGVEFAIIRAGYGREISQKDDYFEANYAGCKANGIPCGAYWVCYADDRQDSIVEANAFLEAVKGKTFEYPLYYDVEDWPESDYYFSKKPNVECDAMITNFCTTLEQNGCFAGIYSGKNISLAKLSKSVRTRFAFWVAQYYDCCTYPDYHGMWQCASDGRIDGINGNVDIDECYFDYISAIKDAGLNGFSKPSTVAPQISTPASARSYTVQKGDTLWDISQALLKNGSRYREIMVLSGLTSDTIYPGQVLVVPMH